MSDLNRIRQKIEAIVSETAEQHAVALRDSIHKRLLEELNGDLSHAPGTAPTDLLNAAVASVQDATAQTDILKALLDGATHFSRRTALLVVRGNTATGWQARGFTDNDLIKAFTADCGTGLAGRVVNSHTPAGAAADEFDHDFVQRFGTPSDGNVLLLPLVIKGKVAALVYVDGGSEGASGLDRSAVELLVRMTGLWLEVLSLRKTGGVEANHLEAHAAAATAAAPISAPPRAAAAPAHAPVPAEDEFHIKARKFAKLLVEEIKLYNQDKVNEGRSHKDLYDRLREDIDKSRATYDRRYGQTITDVDYFTQELVRILVDNDRAALGANFHW
jgi:hypothetical protein